MLQLYNIPYNKHNHQNSRRKAPGLTLLMYSCSSCTHAPQGPGTRKPRLRGRATPLFRGELPGSRPEAAQQTQKWGLRIFTNMSLAGWHTTTLARHLSVAGDLRMEEKVILAVDNCPILFEQSVHIQGPHSHRFLSGERFDWQQAVSTKTIPPYVRHALCHPLTDGGSVEEALIYLESE